MNKGQLVNDLTLCPICKETFKDAKFLACHCTICASCASKLVQELEIKCPFGHPQGTPVKDGNVENLTSNSIMMSIIASDSKRRCRIQGCMNPPTRFCPKCNGNYCEKHVMEEHKKMTCENSAIPIREHNMTKCFCLGNCSKQAKIFCELCRIPACLQCSMKHSHHNRRSSNQDHLQPIQEMPKLLKRELQSLIELAKGNVEELRMLQKKLNRKIEEGRVNYDNVEQEIEQHFGEIMAAVKRAKEEELLKLNSAKSQYLKVLKQEHDDLQDLLMNYDKISSSMSEFEEQSLEVQYANFSAMQTHLLPFFNRNYAFTPNTFHTARYKKNDSLIYTIEKATGLVIITQSASDLDCAIEAVPTPISEKMILEITTCNEHNQPYFGLANHVPCCGNCHPTTPVTPFNLLMNNTEATLEFYEKEIAKIHDEMQKKRKALYEDGNKAFKACEFLDDNVVAVISDINKTTIRHFMKQKMTHLDSFSKSMEEWREDFKEKTNICMQLKAMQRRIEVIRSIKKDRTAFFLATEELSREFTKLQANERLEQSLTLVSPMLIKDFYSLDLREITDLINKSRYRINETSSLWEPQEVVDRKPEILNSKFEIPKIQEQQFQQFPENVPVMPMIGEGELSTTLLLTSMNASMNSSMSASTSASVLRGSGVLTEILKRIETAKTCGILDFQKIEISANDFINIGTSMKAIPNLKEIKIRQCKLDDMILRALKSNIPTGLQILNLSENNLEELSHLVDGLAEHKSLQKVNLASNKIMSDGFVRLVELLARNCRETLVELMVHNNEIGDDGAAVLQSHLKHFKSLHNKKGKITINRNKISKARREDLKTEAELLEISIIL